jgi:hypothetical protein
MLRICGENNTLARLPVQPLWSADVGKQQRLLKCFANTPNVFFREIGEEFLYLGCHVPGFDASDFVDLLAVDPNGNVTVIDVTGRLAQQQLIRALAHTALVSSWSLEQLLAGVDSARLLNFLRVQPTCVNRRQRLVLAASAFDVDVLATINWLQRSHGVEITCVRIRIIVDTLANIEYLDCERVPVMPHRNRALLAPSGGIAGPVKSVTREEEAGPGIPTIIDADLGGWSIASLSEGVARG